jgi:1-acyl-sn-glycerol-3-phosphate acyltransferase
VAKLYGPLYLAFFVLTSFIFFIFALLLWLLIFWWDKKLVILHRFTCFWGAIYSWAMPAWPLSIVGKEKINKKEVYVIVSNHQSLLDILMYFRLFIDFKWVSKSEIFKVPFIGWNMYLNRYIGIKRGNTASRKRMFIQCSKALRSGSSIFIFPEGTRSTDGCLGRFKSSAFILAQENQVSILPMVISGTALALPKNSLRYNGVHPIKIKILDAIPFSSFKEKTIENITKEVQSILSKEIEAL